MTILIVLLTALLVFDCLVLVLLVLMQLPKKEAGAGLAFGGGATDTLFGAGSGNLLTKATKYAASVFFIGTLLLSIILSHNAKRGDSDFMQSIQEKQKAAEQAPAVLPPANAPEGTAPSGPASTPALSTPGTNALPPINPAPTTATNTSPAPR